MTGSLKTLQHNWQHSFTEGCSANTWGSYKQTQTSGHISNLRMCSCHPRCVSAGCHTVSSSSSCKEKVERRDMLDSEWRDRTEMAESDLRGVPMGGWEGTLATQRSQSVIKHISKHFCYFIWCKLGYLLGIAPFHRHHHGGSRSECWRMTVFFCVSCRWWPLLLETCRKYC